MILISIIITICYSLTIISFTYGLLKSKHFHLTNTSTIIKFSILIPFRNEINNLPTLLESISTLEYPINSYEIVLINDHSEDDSILCIEKFKKVNPKIPIHILNSPLDSKKNAITHAMQHAKYDWILTTDSDCVLPKTWLHIYNSFLLKKESKFVAAPVVFRSNLSFLDNFQQLDFLSLIGCTIGGFAIKQPFLCNGANLCYNKDAFTELNGFKGNEHIASGDDIFLMEKMIKTYPNQVHYLNSKEAIIITQPQKTLTNLISQRVRWASKTAAYKNNFGKIIGSIVLLMNLTWITSLFYISTYPFLFIVIFTIKFTVDSILLQKTVKHLQQSTSVKSYLTSSFLHPIFTVYVALKSFVFRYEWKGRKSLK